MLSQIENDIFKEISILREEGEDLFKKQELGKALDNFEKIIQLDSVIILRKNIFIELKYFHK